jgi:hypothetical protein
MVAKAGTHDGVKWKLSPCLVTMVDEADQIAPRRSKASDGSIASAAHHKQNPDSDHEIDVESDGTAWVDALDLTHDPAGGFDSHGYALKIVARKDERAAYVISQRTIWRSYDKPGLPAWTPQKYTGPDPHTNHMHVSVTDAGRQNTDPGWPDEEDPFMPALTDDEQRRLLGNIDRLAYASDHSVLPTLVAIAQKIDAGKVDPSAIAQAVIAGLDPAKIADAVAAALPADQAQRVADELAKRLAG